MEQKFIVQGKLPSLNEYCQALGKRKGKWNAGYQMKKEWQEYINNCIRISLIQPVTEPIKIKYIYFEENKRRDMDNISAVAKKFINDSLQECGIIKNDNWHWIKSYEEEFFIDKKNPRIEIYLLTP